MTDGDLSHITDKLAAALSRRIDLSDSENMALLIDQHLQAQVLQNYRTQLEGLQGTEMLAWMLHRIAGLEARVLALHAAGQLTEHARESTAGTVPPAAADFAVLPRS
ncbi:MAG: hypothetical protein J0H99_02090, partial [Rhodospirillales bacterium]|nr:hypothetical protein [Rhodospirillales bacterium]